MSRLVSVCERYTDSHGLRHNVIEGEIMVFNAKRYKYNCNALNIKLLGCLLKKVDKFKYLGHSLTPDLKDNEDIKRERRALSVRANMIAGLLIDYTAVQHCDVYTIQQCV